MIIIETNNQGSDSLKDIGIGISKLLLHPSGKSRDPRASTVVFKPKR